MTERLTVEQAFNSMFGPGSTCTHDDAKHLCRECVLFLLRDLARSARVGGATERQQQILAFAEAAGVRDAEYTVAGFGVSRLLKALSNPEFQWVAPSAAPPQPTPAEREDGNVD